MATIKREVLASLRFTGIDEAAASLKRLQDRLKDLRKQQGQATTSNEYGELAKRIAETSAQIRKVKKEQDAANKAFEEVDSAAGSYDRLNAETKRLTTQLNSLSRGINVSAKDYDELKARIKANNAELTNYRRELRNSASLSERVREGGVKAFKDIALQIGGAVTALEGFRQLKGLGQLGLDLERGFAQVNTVAQLSREELNNLQAQVLQTAKDVKATVDLEEIPESLFNIVSATGDVQLSQDILTQSLRAAKAGFSDLNSTASAGTGIYNAVKDQVKDVSEVFDVLFRTQKEGVLTFQDLSKQIPRVIPTANKASVSFQQTASALATITKAGVNADQASTLLDNSLKAIADPKKKDAFEKLGAPIFDLQGNTRDLVAIFGDLNKSLTGLDPESKAEKLSSLGLDSEAAKGIGILTDNFKTLAEVTKSIEAGSVGELERQLGASGNTSDDLKASINELKLTLLDELGPAIKSTATGLIGLIQSFVQLIGFLGRNREVLAVLAGAYAALNAQLIATAASNAVLRVRVLALTVAERAQAVATTIASTAQKAYAVATGLLTGAITLSTVRTQVATVAQAAFNAVLNANPVGLVVTGIVALTTALVLLARRTDEATEAETRRAKQSRIVTDQIKETNKAIGEEVAGIRLRFETLQKAEKGSAKYAKAIESINLEYEKYLPSLLTEKSSLEDIEEAQKLVTQARINDIIQVQKQEATNKALGETVTNQLDVADQLAGTIRGFEGLGDLTAVELTKLAGVSEEVTQRIADAQSKVFESLTKDGIEPQARELEAALKSARDEVVSTLNEQEQRALKVDEAIGILIRKSESQDSQNAERLANRVRAQFQLLRSSEREISDVLNEIEQRFGQLSQIEPVEPVAGPDGEPTTGGLSDEEKKKTEDRREARKDAAKKEQERIAKAIEEANKRLVELRNEQIESDIAAIEDETERQIAELDYRTQQRVAKLNAERDAILATEGLTDAQIEEAERSHQNRLLQIESEADASAEEIRESARLKRLEEEKKTQEAIEKSRKDALSLNIAAVNTELDAEELALAKRRELLKERKELLIQQVNAERDAALEGAKTQEERAAIIRNATAEASRVIAEYQESLKEEGEKSKGLIARALGISDEDAKLIEEALGKVAVQVVQTIDQLIQRQIQAIDENLQLVDARIAATTQRYEQQRSEVDALEERLSTATGARRERLIELIEQEQQEEQTLLDVKRKAEADKARLEQERAEAERRQARVRKAQAIAEATINTAVSITKVFASTVPPLSFILAGLYGALGAAQIATISAQKFRKGGWVDGPSHEGGGVKYQTPGGVAELEGNEFIVRKSVAVRHKDLLEDLNKNGDRENYRMVPNGHWPKGKDGKMHERKRPDHARISEEVANQKRLIGLQEIQNSLLRRLIDSQPDPSVLARNIGREVADQGKFHQRRKLF